MTSPDTRIAIDASAVPVDVTDPDSAAAMCARVLDRWGRVDVLINNAGIAGPTAPVADYPPGAWQQVIAVNLKNRAAYQLSAVLIVQGGDRGGGGMLR